MYADSRKAQALFAIEDVHQQHDALLAVVGHEDPLNFRERTLSNTEALAGLQVGDTGLVAREALADPRDGFVGIRDRILAEAHQPDDTPRGSDRMPVIVQFGKFNEQVAGKQGLGYVVPRTMAQMPQRAPLGDSR